MALTAPDVRPRLAGRMGGTDGNERLTALTAVTLFGLLAVEGVTIVFLGQLLWVHLFVGVVLIPPVALKLASTGWRFARYYTGHPAYVRKGPPPILLRASAPLVVVSTLGVLGTGVWLLLAGPGEAHTILPLHKGSFIVWVAVTGLHVLGHLLDVPRALSDEYGGRRPAGGRNLRAVGVALALVAGVALGVVLARYYGTWIDWRNLRFDG